MRWRDCEPVHQDDRLEHLADDVAERVEVGRFAGAVRDGLLDRRQVLEEPLLGVADQTGRLDLLGVLGGALQGVPGAVQLSGQPGLTLGVLAAVNRPGVVVALRRRDRTLDAGDLGLRVGDGLTGERHC